MSDADIKQELKGLITILFHTGLCMAGSIVGFFFLGYWIESLVPMNGIIIVTMTGLGIGSGFFYLYKRLTKS